MIRFSCDNCEKKLKVPYEYVSKKVKCPSCATALVVPEPPEPEQSVDEANIFSDLKSDLEQMESQGTVDHVQNELLRESRQQHKDQEIDDNQWHKAPKKKKTEKESTGELKADMAKLPLAILLGCIGAAIGAGVWAVIAIVSIFYSGITVIAIGFVTGTGVVISGHTTGIRLGVISAVITLCGILGGKYIVVSFVADTTTAIGQKYINKTTPKEIHDYIRQDDSILGMAAVFDFHQSGEVDKPQMEEYEEYYYDGDFEGSPQDIQDLNEFAMEMGLAWDRPTRYQKVMAWRKSLLEIDDGARKEAVFTSFSIIEIGGALLAIGLAFKIGMGNYSQI